MWEDIYPKAGAVFQYFCSQNPSKISKSNGSEGVYFSQKAFFIGGMATQHPMKHPMKKVHRRHFEELVF